MSAGLAVATAGQRAAARLLVDLLDGELPLVGWDVCGIQPGRLNGQLGSHTGDLAYRLSALSVYARLLGAPAILRRWKHKNAGALHVVGTVHGVPTDVWTAVDEEELAALDGPEFAGVLGERWECRDCRTGMFALSEGLSGDRPALCAHCAPYARF